VLTVLSIAGFDPSGGAGVLADLKTFAAMGCYGAAAITSITSQNTIAVYGAYDQPVGVVRAQLEPLISDLDFSALKTGMLPTGEIIELVAETIECHSLSNVVVDPVMRSSSGYELIDPEVTYMMIERLLPLADLITPNLAEAERLTGLEVKDLDGMKHAARKIREITRTKRRGARGAVLIKGGHLKDEAADLLDDGKEVRVFRSPRIESRNNHGTGCTLSSAIAALLAQGYEITESIARAKRYLEGAMREAPNIGQGNGPLGHFYDR
jgi:hydroxymethylpyrimidine/phosphomethylpyrimidine kinase